MDAGRRAGSGLAAQAVEAEAAVGVVMKSRFGFLTEKRTFFAFCFDFIPLFHKEMNFKNEVERKKEKNIRSNTVSDENTLRIYTILISILFLAVLFSLPKKSKQDYPLNLTSLHFRNFLRYFLFRFCSYVPPSVATNQ